MVGNEAITTAHRTQIRVPKDGLGASGLQKRAMRVVETGRSLATVEIPEYGRPLRTAAEPSMEPEANEIDVWQLPNQNSSSISNQPKELESRNRKRKFPSEPVELYGLPRRSKRIRKARLESEFQYY